MERSEAEEIIQKIIKECASHGECGECSFYEIKARDTLHSCICCPFSEVPCTWEIKKGE